MRTRNRILSMLAAAGLAIGILSTTVFATEIRCEHPSWKWESNPVEHWERCTVCLETRNESSHSMEQKKDENEHWEECSVCQWKNNIDAHDWNNGVVTTSATCTTAGVKTYTCRKCWASKTESIDASGHCWRDTWTSDATHHWRECGNENCPVTDNSGKDGYAEHTGGTATCTDKAVCEICGAKYGETNPANHTGTAGADWHADNSAHWKEYNCCKAHVQTAAHSGDSNATCIQEGSCRYCGVSYYGDHAYGAFSFDENKHWQKCIYCDNVQNKSSHNFSEYLKSEATCVSPEVYDMICTDCDYQVAVTRGDRNPDNHDLVNHAAKAPTCTEIGWDAYKTCQREGCDYTTYAEIPALNHDLVHHEAKTPTCTEIGWDAYDICQRCGYTTFKELPALGHWYGEWTPNSSHTHLASCKRGCGHRAATSCAALDYVLLTEGADSYEFTLCPVCGEVSDGAQLKLIDQTTAQPITRWLPAGEKVLRLGTLENGELLLTAAFEISGQLIQPTGQVQFTLPAEHLEGMALTILHPDGAEEPLDYTVEKDKATFTLDFTDRETLAMTLHLTPET